MLSEDLKLLIQKLKENISNGEKSNSEFLSVRYNKGLKEEIEKITSHLDLSYQKIEIGQRLWHIREGIEHVKICSICNETPLKWYRYTNGYFKTCGNSECKSKEKSKNFKETVGSEEYRSSGKLEKWMENKSKTMMEKYGVDHNWKGHFRDSHKQILIEKYGVEHPMKSDEIQKKRKSTLVDRFGTSDMFSLEKTKKTNLIKWGFESPMKNDEVKMRVSKEMKRSKNKKTEEKLIKWNINLICAEDLNYELKCNKCNSDFSMSYVGLNIRLRREIDPCPKCNPIALTHSGAEKEILSLIRKNYTGQILENHKDLFKGSRKFSEVDIYLPDKKIAIEYNGVYWHGEFYKSKNYHIEKTEYLKKIGVDLYHIWEDDWIFNRELSESWILNLIGKSKKIWARKCKISSVSGKEYKEFCEVNHLQGYSPGSIILGLYYDNELVSVMSFGKPRKLINSKALLSSENSWELIRLCSKRGISVVGGASRLFSFFLNQNFPDEVASYCDISRSPDPEKSVYKKLGFSNHKKTDPGYFWVVDGKRQNRLNWTKKKLLGLGKDPNKSEIEIMQEMGNYRIWDCGNYKFIWNKTKDF
jgi:hypothetical protein